LFLRKKKENSPLSLSLSLSLPPPSPSPSPSHKMLSKLKSYLFLYSDERFGESVRRFGEAVRGLWMDREERMAGEFFGEAAVGIIVTRKNK